MSSYVAGIIGAVILVVFVFEMLRRRVLQEKFAALWLLVSLGVLVLAIFPAILVNASAFLGIQVPSNLLLLLASLLLLFASIQMSYEIGRGEKRIRRLAEEVALLRHEVGQLREDSRGTGRKAPQAQPPVDDSPASSGAPTDEPPSGTA